MCLSYKGSAPILPRPPIGRDSSKLVAVVCMVSIPRCFDAAPPLNQQKTKAILEKKY
jgi:hypothetical protein